MTGLKFTSLQVYSEYSSMSIRIQVCIHVQ